MRRSGLAVVVLAVGAAQAVAAQTTATTSFNAPYRAFARYELGATVSFPEGGGTALEAAYRFGTGQFDVGLRAGIFDPSGAGDTRVLLGVTGRHRVVTHSADFPLDGALVFGVGGVLVEDFSALIIPGGISLGRRLDVEGSEVSIIPYVQPTAFITTGLGSDFVDTDLNFAFGFGADFRLSRVFDARLSIGLGDLEGVSISAVWVR